ncbi:helix-turn-helix domain-containing protein [Rhodopseudomonas palustris]|uniref:helix-turn-helix domain-containing protein n=1 Tax=Rhodopseudomonas palustris TaxID=1076 RepID=UPI0012D4254F|nr:helix-turn-helix transcriptional regulator [Rhodopseudomonas palustris]
MTNEQVREARAKLGEMWKAGGGSLTAKELARALGLSEKYGTDHVYNMESGKSAVSGTVEMLLRIYLAGGVPPDDVVIFRDPKPRKRSP